MDFTVRPATPADASAICTLLNEVDEAEIGRPETDLHAVEGDLQRPGTDLARDSWLAVAGGRPVAFGLVWDDSGGERIDADLYVHPRHQEAGRRLLMQTEARAAERAEGNGAARAVVHLYLNVSTTLDTSALTARGWHVIRRFHVLTRPLSPAADTVPEPLPGVTLRTCTAAADRRRAHALLESAFAEHFEHRPRTYEEWLEAVDGQRVDWSLVWIAAVDGHGDAAVLLGKNDGAAMGWIRSLGVLKEARGHGLGGHLLRHAFAAFAARGRDAVGLGVDTLNATNALRLYERHGMALHYAVDTWQVELAVSPTAR